MDDNERIRMRPTAARVRLILLVAAVLVLSTMGGAGAAALITGHQIKDGTVTGRDIRDHSLRPKDARRGVVRRGPRGPQGTIGDTGLPGAQGVPGRNGLGGFVTVVSPDAFIIPGNTSATSSVACPAGWSALGGGVAGADPASVDAMAVTRDMPRLTATAGTNGWQVTVLNESGVRIFAFVWAQCAPL